MTGLPTWHQEALEQNIGYIVLAYNKADGFIFCPDHLARPFGVGGAHGGSYDVTTEIAVDHFEKFFLKRGELKWFYPFLGRVYFKEDFSLSELNLEKRQVLILARGRWDDIHRQR